MALIMSRFLYFCGIFAKNFIEIFALILKGKVDFNSLYKEFFVFVSNVIQAVFLISVALGLVIAVQLGPEFVSRGLGTKLGILSALTMTRELIPVIGSMMVATQYGTGLAAQIAHMKVSEQIDAIKIFGINPLYYLAVPRIIAAAIMNPLVIWLASVLAVTSSYLILWLRNGLALHSFLSSIEAYFHIKDIMLCFFKASVFGILIVLIAVSLGLETTGGAKEVGKATTLTVIVSFLVIIVLDYLITSVYL